MKFFKNLTYISTICRTSSNYSLFPQRFLPPPEIQTPHIHSLCFFQSETEIESYNSDFILRNKLNYHFWSCNSNSLNSSKLLEKLLHLGFIKAMWNVSDIDNSWRRRERFSFFLNCLWWQFLIFSRLFITIFFGWIFRQHNAGSCVTYTG